MRAVASIRDVACTWHRRSMYCSSPPTNGAAIVFPRSAILWFARRISTRSRPKACSSAVISPTLCHAVRAARRFTPGCTCRIIAREPTARRSTRGIPTGRRRRHRTVTIRCCSATPTRATIRADSTPGDPWLKSYEGPLPGIRPVCLLIGDADAVDRLAQGARFRGPCEHHLRLRQSRRRAPTMKTAPRIPSRSSIRRNSTTPRSWSARRLTTSRARGPFIAHLSTAAAASAVRRARALQLDVRSREGAGLHAPGDARR